MWTCIWKAVCAHAHASDIMGHYRNYFGFVQIIRVGHDLKVLDQPSDFESGGNDSLYKNSKYVQIHGDHELDHWAQAGSR
jgi:hypothetical protein